MHKTFSKVYVAFGILALTLVSHANAKDLGGGYYLRVYNTSGSEPAWANSHDSFGISRTSTHGFVCVTYGSDWGGHSAQPAAIPRRINTIRGNVTTNFSQSSSSNKFDAAYDIWFDGSYAPTNRNSSHEMMWWLQWAGTQPIAGSYDRNGNAVPYATNVSLGGYRWNVYYRRGSQSTFSFLLTSQRGSISTTVKPFWEYAIQRGWMGSTEYLNSIMAGWENVGGGAYSANSFNCGGF